MTGAASHGPTDVAATFAGNWVRRYTVWVGAEAAERRRAEVASDVWEQRADAQRDRRPSILTSASIVRRVVAGMPADLLWVRTERLVRRGVRAGRKASHPMNRFLYILAGWWWVFLAAGFAAFLIVAGVSELATNREAGLEGNLQPFALAAVLALGVALRIRFPRASAALIVSGGFLFLFLWFLPVTWLLSFPLVGGAAVDALRRTPGGVGRKAVAAVGLLLVGVAWLIPGLGLMAQTTALALGAAAAAIGVVLLALTSRPGEVRPAAG